MNVSYRFSSPQGEIVVDDSMLNRPFAVGPAEYHRFMTLRDFFDCVRRSLLSEKGLSLDDILGRVRGRPVKGEEIEEVMIRYEKYGTLYQICSIDVSAGGNSSRVCASVALSDAAKQTLEREFELLAQLEETRGSGTLPRVFKKDWIEVIRESSSERLLVVILEWFEGYEEWHFQRHEGTTRAFLWDMRGGYRFLSEAQTYDMICQASRILTIHYDMESTKRITPWHHGGGDFVVRASDTDVDVRLVTARGYEPIESCDGKDAFQGLCAFFIETSTKMRLDKWEGMGDSTWADSLVADAALKGFVEGLRVKETRGEMAGLKTADVLRKLKAFDTDHLRRFVRKQLLVMRECDSSDYRVVLSRLDSHAGEIRSAIQSFPDP